MSDDARKHGGDLRATAELVVAATQAVTKVAEELHRTIASGPAVLGRPLALPARALTALAYGNVRRVTALVGLGLDAALAQLEPLLGASAPGLEREVMLAVLNGVLGDHLSERGNPLALEFSLRPVGEPGPKLLVLVHGSCMTARQWCRNGHDHGAELARELGYTPVYVRYNSGLHISTNGRSLAHELDALVRAWPVPVAEIALLGHSMGGLVARSACREAELAQLGWRSQLKQLICLGSPHHGTGLERGGSWLQALLGVSAYSAPFERLARIRSAGVTDLRHGNVLDAHWHGRDRFALDTDERSALPLPQGVACYAVAGTTARASASDLPGDGLVSVASALGQHRVAERTLAFPQAHQLVAFGSNHLDLLDSPEVYAALRAWLGGSA